METKLQEDLYSGKREEGASIIKSEKRLFVFAGVNILTKNHSEKVINNRSTNNILFSALTVKPSGVFLLQLFTVCKERFALLKNIPQVHLCTQLPKRLNCSFCFNWTNSCSKVFDWLPLAGKKVWAVYSHYPRMYQCKILMAILDGQETLKPVQSCFSGIAGVRLTLFRPLVHFMSQRSLSCYGNK